MKKLLIILLLILLVGIIDSCKTIQDDVRSDWSPPNVDMYIIDLQIKMMERD